MKYQVTEPFARRADEGVKASAEPDRLEKLVEDPKAEKRDMSAEQRAGLKKVGQPDARVVADDADQSRTR